MKKRIFALVMAAALLVSAAACAATGAGGESRSDTSDAQSNAEALAVSARNSDDQFTDRDFEVTYHDFVPIDLADGATRADGIGVSVSGDVVTINTAGVYLLTGTLTNGQIVVDVPETDKVQLVLSDAAVENTTGAAIDIRQADKVFITTAADTINSVVSEGTFETTGENNADGAIFSQGDLTLNGRGTLNVRSAGHGVASKDDLVITSGVLNVQASAQGVSGKDSVRIGGGEVTIDAGAHGVKAAGADDATKGYVYVAAGNVTIRSAEDGLHAENAATINGGSLTIDAGDDGIHAGAELLINDGVVRITNSYEAIEGGSVTINGGDVDLRASDDGINVAGGNDDSGSAYSGGSEPETFVAPASGGAASLTINGGSVLIDADGDGADSNGTIELNGGTLFVSGPTNGGNGAMDHCDGAVVNGGTAVIVGSVGPDCNFTGGTQNAFLVRLDSAVAGGETLIVNDSAGNVIVTFTPEKTYQSVLVTSPALKTGETYTVIVGGQSVSVDQTSRIVSAANADGPTMG